MRFWPWVRERIWEKAYELHAGDFQRSHGENPTTPTRRELREDGYFHRAKLIVLREVSREMRGRTSRDDEDLLGRVKTRMTWHEMKKRWD
ncbi:hypothetical protein AC482_03415 [miscellaneous Crenarchaeota group-15 archaeon DG-45]|uniref:Uncharacterized protein n=1 Tax=miscellaneous Crenarchaeota group-15 archaeon DG-45 TaxID=1685127 RepID=A0A0M0BQA6_9ARCH|nr:MAG: hypothetical protein AC482_03415 [miscellaneous Crenarchaeota group-15 archaeon DG-45]